MLQKACAEKLFYIFEIKCILFHTKDMADTNKKNLTFLPCVARSKKQLLLYFSFVIFGLVKKMSKKT